MTTRAKANAETILSARGIVNRFGKQVVHDRLSLDIAPGEIHPPRGDASVAAGQQAVVQVQLGLEVFRLGQAGDADDFLDAEPEGLAILEDERELRPDADAAIAVDVAAMRVEELFALRRVFFQRQEIIHR